MRLAIYGRRVVLKSLLLTLTLDIIAILIPVFEIKLTLLILSLLLFAFTLYFFRDPIRNLPDDIKENDIISPADGKVIIIKETNENKYLKCSGKLIAIFLSPLDVHVNRIPVSGKIEHYEYIKGSFKAAFRHDSSDTNERTVIGIENGNFKLLLKQVAGFVARRIVSELKIGDNVRIGEKFGMIKFGSRVDVIVPENSTVKVSVNQKVKAGETIIAKVNLK